MQIHIVNHLYFFFLFFIVIGHCWELSLKYPANRVLISFTFCILNLSNNFFLYFSCNTQIFLLFYHERFSYQVSVLLLPNLSLQRIYSRIHQAGIFFVSYLTINILSTYKRIMRKSPSTSLSKETIIYKGLVESMIHHKGFELLVPLLRYLLESIQAFLDLAHKINFSNENL